MGQNRPAPGVINTAIVYQIPKPLKQRADDTEHLPNVVESLQKIRIHFDFDHSPSPAAQVKIASFSSAGISPVGGILPLSTA
jgi:hypothetical protein